MSTGNIVRSKKTGKDRYTPISNSVIQNKNLTTDARIILIYLLSLPADWVVRKGQVQDEMTGMSRTRFNTAFKLLVEMKYIHQFQQYKGNIKNGFNYIVYEEPTPDTPTTDTPSLGIPTPVNREQSTTKYTETKYTDTKETLTNNEIQSNNLETNTNSLDKVLHTSKTLSQNTNTGTNTRTREEEISNLFQPMEPKNDIENLYHNLTPELQREADRQLEREFQKMLNK